MSSAVGNPRQSRGTGQNRDPYLMGSLHKALLILEQLNRSSRPLSIKDLVAQTEIERGTVFRVLYTLEKSGYVERLPNKAYRSKFHRRARLGYSAPLAGTPFRRDVLRGLEKAAAKYDAELLVLDNTDKETGMVLDNIKVFLEAGVDLVIEFQPVETVAHLLADRFSSAGIQVIAVDGLIPGTVFFGANNYQAGKLAGQTLGRFANERWGGRFDKVVLIGSSLMPLASKARTTGAKDGIEELVGDLGEERIIRLDGQTHVDTSRAAALAMLNGLAADTRLLISAFNDPSAVGALQAVRALGRERQVAIVGQNGTEEARAEIRNPDSPFIASVAYFPERFGERLLSVAMSIIKGDKVPLAIYIDNIVLAADNIEKYYPAAPKTPDSHGALESSSL